jgi:hypothetical protein
VWAHDVEASGFECAISVCRNVKRVQHSTKETHMSEISPVDGVGGSNSAKDLIMQLLREGLDQAEGEAQSGAAPEQAGGNAQSSALEQLLNQVQQVTDPNAQTP